MIFLSESFHVSNLVKLQVWSWSIKGLPLSSIPKQETKLNQRQNTLFLAAMMGGREDGEVGFEEAMSWLPSHVVDEAIWDANKEGPVKPRHHHHYRSLQKLAPHHHALNSKSRQRAHGRTEHPTNWVSGGSGMQAIFLDSGQKSCGTGVFLPRRAGTDSQLSKKPACSPVLLPARVVQALNLNVHELGLQISRRQDARSNSKLGDSNSVKNKNGKDVSAQCYAVSQNENNSPEIFLPKEWTY